MCTAIRQSGVVSVKFAPGAVRTMSEKFENVTITGHYRVVFEEVLSRGIS